MHATPERYSFHLNSNTRRYGQHTIVVKGEAGIEDLYVIQQRGSQYMLSAFGRRRPNEKADEPSAEDFELLYQTYDQAFEELWHLLDTPTFLLDGKSIKKPNLLTTRGLELLAQHGVMPIRDIPKETIADKYFLRTMYTYPGDRAIYSLKQRLCYTAECGKRNPVFFILNGKREPIPLLYDFEQSFVPMIKKLYDNLPDALKQNLFLPFVSPISLVRASLRDYALEIGAGKLEISSEP